jgi:predicted dehydrogenase
MEWFSTVRTEELVAASRKRIGVIGVGFGAQVHVPGLQSEGWEVAAVCSRNRDKATQIAQAAGVRDVHTDARELIRRDDLDAVAITTPPGVHCELAVAALSAGKHVLCEKPFAIDTKEATVMRDAADASGPNGDDLSRVQAYAAARVHQAAAGRRVRRQVPALHHRAVSRPLHDAATACAHLECVQRAGWRIARRAGSHYIDGLRYWFGEIASVYGHLEALRPDVLDAATNRIVKAETDDTFLFTLQFANGGLATMTSSFAATPTRGARIVVMGERGTLIAEQPGPNPMEDGVVIASRDGSPLAPLETPGNTCPSRMRETIG